ncbi:alpha-amylase family glycosyl hydrolase [Bacillus sp. MUM 13]|uniref:alpha-amylase family glycosyl hydrolase n=1 Tax=Bacillus sp. MUM 13 TaxID=1678001 RepID=UPI0008F599A1|nr:alpha-amylase family glycosyl hydrolase [Bacillus sp. MUM 13]OIK14102.1 alpha-amlyase [Bacillus sp. MUM 13]
MKKRVLSLLLIPFLLFYALPAEAAEKEERTLGDEVIYSLVIDRFNDGNVKNDAGVNVYDAHAYNGGDFAGITEKLDYLKDMGFTSILLSPIFDNEGESFQSGLVKDFYKPDEHYGTIKEFRKLVHAAHKKHLKIILDFDVNTIGPHHPWLKDPAKKNWVRLNKEVSSTGSIKLDQENPETKKYLVEMGSWWIKETNIDGYRLDKMNDISQSFWLDLAHAAKSVKKDFYLIGELQDLSKESISAYEKAGIRGFMDHTQTDPMRSAFKKPNGDLSPLFSELNRNQQAYTHPEASEKFIDNKDMPRFTYDINARLLNPGTRWKMALSYMYTSPGVPVIYYGSEIALNGGKAPDNQRLMGFKTEKELIDYITKLGELRKKYPSLRKGSMKLLYEKDGMAVFKRTYKEETMAVAINNTDKSQTVRISGGEFEKGKELRGLLEGDLVRSKGDTYTIILDREKTEVYELAPKSGINMAYIFAMAAVIIAFAIFIALILKRGKRNPS